MRRVPAGAAALALITAKLRFAYRTDGALAPRGFFAEQPNAGVKRPAAGAGLRVLRRSGTSMTVKLFKTK